MGMGRRILRCGVPRKDLLRYSLLGTHALRGDPVGDLHRCASPEAGWAVSQERGHRESSFEGEAGQRQETSSCSCRLLSLA